MFEGTNTQSITNNNCDVLIVFHKQNMKSWRRLGLRRSVNIYLCLSRQRPLFIMFDARVNDFSRRQLSSVALSTVSHSPGQPPLKTITHTLNMY